MVRLTREQATQLVDLAMQWRSAGIRAQAASARDIGDARQADDDAMRALLEALYGDLQTEADR